jgi:O-antigen ligase
VLLSSKLGLITLTLIYLIALIRYSFKNYTIGIIGLILVIATGLGIVKFVPAITDRVKTATAALTSSTVNNADAESTSVRMLIWKAANQVIAEHPIVGTGTGDSKDELIKEYERRGMTGAVEHHLNAHNEFYQVFVALGLIGFTIFCMQLVIPLALSIREKCSIYTFFLIILILNFLTESMLEGEAGVLFYAFFNSVLCFTLFQKKLISN